MRKLNDLFATMGARLGLRRHVLKRLVPPPVGHAIKACVSAKYSDESCVELLAMLEAWLPTTERFWKIVGAQVAAAQALGCEVTIDTEAPVASVVAFFLKYPEQFERLLQDQGL